MIDSVFPLEAAADAHRRMESGEHVGKIAPEVAAGAGSEKWTKAFSRLFRWASLAGVALILPITLPGTFATAH